MVHYPAPGDEYVLMPLKPGQTALTDVDITGAHAFAGERGWRIVRLIGVQRGVEGVADSIVWLAAPIDGYADTLHGVMESVEHPRPR